MAFLFGKRRDVPPVTPPVTPPPEREDSAQASRRATAALSNTASGVAVDRVGRRGRSGTILTGPLGVLEEPELGRKTLLGS